MKNLKITLNDLRSGKERQEHYHYEEKSKKLVYLNEGKEVLHDVATFSGEANGIEVSVAFQYNDQYSESILSFCQIMYVLKMVVHMKLVLKQQ